MIDVRGEAPGAFGCVAPRPGLGRVHLPEPRVGPDLGPRGMFTDLNYIFEMMI